jgi:hypothetical protein
MSRRLLEVTRDRKDALQQNTSSDYTPLFESKRFFYWTEPATARTNHRVNRAPIVGKQKVGRRRAELIAEAPGHTE